MKRENPEIERNILRNRWRDIRDERLNLKKHLFASGRTITEIRHDRDYMRLKKEQKVFSKMIRHIERKIAAGKNEA